MKNIKQILSSLGIEVPAEKEDELNKLVNENYKTISEFEKKVEKLESERDGLSEQLTVTADALKKFDGVDPEKLNGQIEKLKNQAEQARIEFENKMADRDFNDKLKDAITSANGLNAKAITALLDIDTLRASHNWDVDIKSAIDTLKTAEDSKMLFKAESNQAQFSAPLNPGGKGETTSLRDMTLEERTQLKATNPQLYESLRKECSKG